MMLHSKFSRLLFLGLLVLFFVAVTGVSALAAGPPDFLALKDAVWAQQPDEIPLAPQLAPGRLLQMQLFPENLQSAAADAEGDAWTLFIFQVSNQNHSHIGKFTPGGYRIKYITYGATDEFFPTAAWEAGHVAFVSNRDGNNEIYSLNRGNGELKRLTNHAASDSFPSWAPGKSVIAFTRKVDGQEEIFRMDTNGSHVQRLTNHPAQDLFPSWSPDGKYIIWARRQGRNAALWQMNADGSNPHALTAPLPYLQNPRWSPKGNLIAFDYDADGDGLNELAVMNVDGSNLHTVFDANTDLVDLWLGDWSPRGDRLLFSVILYVVIDGKLYIQDSLISLCAKDGKDAHVAVADDRIVRHPVWRLLDHQAPESGMEPLPQVSPGPFDVKWHGQDYGPSGIRCFDVQVREDDESEWRFWQECTYSRKKSYPGRGGHRYTFRVRARDRAGNFEPWPEQPQAHTTVENFPPKSTMKPLQHHERKDPLIEWSTVEVGGSPACFSDLQYREGKHGEWTDWITLTLQRSAYFPAKTGVHYYFRVRSRDSADNIEPWPEGDGNTSTIVYGWKLAGTAKDVREAPVAGVQLHTEPPEFELHPSDDTGAFVAYGHDGVDTLSATWSKQGYGQLPAAHYTTDKDIETSIILPPVDNQILGSNFESELDSAWHPSAQIAKIVTHTVHTGLGSLQLGCERPLLSPPETLAEDCNEQGVGKRQFADWLVDEQDRVHFVHTQKLANTQNERLIYRYREKDGTWSPLEQILVSSSQLGQLKMVADHSGQLHVLATENIYPYRLYYLRRDATGLWHSFYTLPAKVFSPALVSMVVDSHNNLHMLFGRDKLYYVSRSASGVWTEITPVQDATNYFNHLAVRIDSHDTLHVSWGNRHIHYLRRDQQGRWSQAQVINPTMISDGYQMRVDNAGGAHFFWRHSYENKVYYASVRPDGHKTEPIPVSQGISSLIFPAFMDVEQNGTVHIILLSWPYKLHHLQKTPDGQWSAESSSFIDPDHKLQYGLRLHTMRVDEDSRLHLLWMQWDDTWGYYYAQWRSNDSWSSPVMLAQKQDSQYLTLQQDARNGLHFMLLDTYGQLAPTYLRTTYQNFADEFHHVSQSVSVPQAAAQPTLSLFHQFRPNAGKSQFQVLVDDGQSSELLQVTHDDAWQHSWADMTPWAGKTVTLTLQVHQAAASICAQAYVDEVSLGSYSFPDLWIGGSAEVAAPGETVHHSISFANSGPIPANNVVITTTLPAAFTLIDANPTPIQDGETLRWDVGTLTAQSKLSTIHFTTRLNAGTASPATLHQHWYISSQSAESVIENNTADVLTFVGGERTYLPTMLFSP